MVWQMAEWHRPRVTIAALLDGCGQLKCKRCRLCSLEVIRGIAIVLALRLLLEEAKVQPRQVGASNVKG